MHKHQFGSGALLCDKHPPRLLNRKPSPNNKHSRSNQNQLQIYENPVLRTFIMSGNMVNVPQAPRELLSLQNRLIPLLSSLQSLYETVERNPTMLNLAHIQQHLQILSTLLSNLSVSIPKPEQIGQNFY